MKTLAELRAPRLALLLDNTHRIGEQSVEEGSIVPTLQWLFGERITRITASLPYTVAAVLSKYRSLSEVGGRNRKLSDFFVRA